VKILDRAGFTGNDLRASYAIVMRESKGQNLDESSPWYSGALGIFQIQTSAHSGKSWWSRSAMLDPQQQARIAYKYLSARGSSWQHWGLGETKKGQFYLDTSLYGGWSSWQHQNWIWYPFQKYWNEFPKKCKSLL
jgi:hypothetical protein